MSDRHRPKRRIIYGTSEIWPFVMAPACLSTDVLAAWTPDRMPASFPTMIRMNPFFVIDGPDGVPVAMGSLDLAAASVEAIFTLPDLPDREWLG